MKNAPIGALNLKSSKVEDFFSFSLGILIGGIASAPVVGDISHYTIRLLDHISIAVCNGIPFGLIFYVRI